MKVQTQTEDRIRVAKCNENYKDFIVIKGNFRYLSVLGGLERNKKSRGI